jgi:two-component sensor histidine kinase
VLEWRESDGPAVVEADIESFGSRLLKRLVEGQLAGTIRRELHPSGVACVIEFAAPQSASAEDGLAVGR